MRTNILRATLQGDDVGTMFRRVIESRPELSSLPSELSTDMNFIAPTTRWVDDALAKFKRSVYASWPGTTSPVSAPLVSADRRKNNTGGSVQVHLRAEWSVACVVEYVLSIGSWLAVFANFHYDNESWVAERSSFDGLHLDLGWGCMFVGAKGHERLVSRRWLEYGPWWLRRFPGDVSLVQFHDLDADADTALAQATPGHRRMSDHEIGGWLRSSYRPVSSYKKEVSDFRALYVPDDQSLRVVCMPGRDITQAELLDACAERLVARYNPDKPVRSLRYVFIDPRDAERNLHELWLRDIEVWAIVGGNEVRLDADYRPPPTPPEWVRLAQERGDQ